MKLKLVKEKDNEYTKLLETIAASDDESKKDYEDKKTKLESELKIHYTDLADELYSKFQEHDEELNNLHYDLV